MAAREATKMGLIGPVAFIDRPAHCTRAAGAAWINVDHSHARLRGFVADKRPELPKRPGVARTTLLASNRDSLPNPVQVFEHECLTLRACLQHQRLADAVIDVFLEAVLTPSILAQPPARSASIRQLQTAAMIITPLPNSLDLLPAVRLAIRVRGKVHDAKIDTQVASWLIRSGRGLRLRDAQIPDIRTPDQFRAANLPGRIVQIAALEIAQHKLSNYTTCQRIQAHPIQTEESIGAGIVTNAAAGGEGRTGLRNDLISDFVASLRSRAYRANRFGSLVPGTARQLCAQAKIRAGRAIDQVVQFVLVRHTLLPRDRGTIARRRIKGGLGLAQGGISRRINGEFAAYSTCGECYCHKDSISQPEHMYKRCLMRINEVSMRCYSVPPLGL